MAARPSGSFSGSKRLTGSLKEAVGKTGPLVRKGVGDVVGKVPVTGPLLRDAVAPEGKGDQTQARNIRTFILVWFGQLISLLGSGLSGFALGVWAFQRTGSTTQYTMIVVLFVLPNVLFLPVAGSLVDRWDRREMMLLSTVGSSLAVMSIFVLVYLGWLEVWHIYISTVVRSLFNTLQIPAYSSLPTLLVPKKHLPRASGLVQTAQAISTIMAPLMAGSLLAIIGLHGMILFDVGTYLFAIVTLLFADIPRPAKAVGTGVLMKEMIGKAKEGTGVLLQGSLNRASGGTGRLNQVSLSKTGLLVKDAVSGTTALLRQKMGDLQIDEDKLDFEKFTSTDAMTGTLPLVRESIGKSKGEKSSVLRDSLQGWKFIRERRGLLIMLITFAGINFAVGLSQALFTPLILSFTTAAVLSRIVSCAGVGLLMGGLLMSTWGGPKQRVVGAISFACLVSLCVASVGFRPSAILVAGGMFGMTCASALLNGCTQALWQVKTPQAIQGRVFAVRRMIGQSTLPLAYFMAGTLADGFFEPMMAVDGWLGKRLGSVIGAGPGRGIGLMFIFSGIVGITLASFSFFHPRFRRIETELKDAI